MKKSWSKRTESPSEPPRDWAKRAGAKALAYGAQPRIGRCEVMVSLLLKRNETRT
jgi:hypothetical protein